MREIKSRGRQLSTGKWIYGDLVHDNIGGYYVYPMDCNGLFRENRVAADSVGQYTGLHDRKDREIYEGDILFVEFADKSGGYYLVGWNDKTAAWGIMDRYEYRSIHDGYDFAEFKNHTLLAFFKEAIIFEVAGNIHDNPELMNIPKTKK